MAYVRKNVIYPNTLEEALEQYINQKFPLSVGSDEAAKFFDFLEKMSNKKLSDYLRNKIISYEGTLADWNWIDPKSPNAI